MKFASTTILTVSAVMFGVACAQTGMSKAGGPNDPQIAHIVVTANQIDIDAGKVAKSRSRNKEVQAFADRMIEDHMAVNKQASDLAKKLGVKPEDNATSQSLADGARKNMDNLRKAADGEFDKAYINHEVAYHQAVLDAIDKTLVPSAQNAELKGLIQKVRPAIAAHLDHAKMVQSKLGGM